MKRYLGFSLVLMWAGLFSGIENPVFAQREFKLTASDANSVAHFGQAVALDGDTAVIGAPSESEMGITAGAGYVYTRSAGGQVLETKLFASNASAFDFFGSSVAIQNGVIVAGAPQNSDVADSAGAAYIFETTASGWVETDIVYASDPQVLAEFGWSVAIDGNYIVVGAPMANTATSNIGAAYIFRRTAAGWVEDAVLTADDTVRVGLFGEAVSITDSTVLIGADATDAGATNAGAAYVFQKNGQVWSQEARLAADDPQIGDLFGSSVAIITDLAIVGAMRPQSIGSRTGAAYIFRRTPGGWIQEARITGSNTMPGDLFGTAVALEGNVALVGAALANGNVPESGAAYLFRRTASNWSQVAMLTASDGAQNDNFGISVALGGRAGIVGSDMDDHEGFILDAGSAYVYLPPGSVSKQIGEQPAAPNTFALLQNYPNPFNPSTSLRFVVPESEASVHVTLRIYDITGRLVRTLVDAEVQVGTHSVLWDGRNDQGEAVAAGIYIYRIEAGTFRAARKMILAK